MKTIFAAGALAMSVPVAAQEEVPPAPKAATLIADSSPQIMLRSGEEIPLRLLEELTTKKKKLRVGYRFQMSVAEDVRVRDVVVIPAGSPAVGEVTQVRNKGMWGRSGYIAAQISTLRVGDRIVRMSGTFDDKGVAGGWGAGVASAVVFLPAGFFMTGTSAVIPSGAIVKGFLGEDLVFQAEK